MELGLIREAKHLFLKEIKTEWRNRFAINGLIVQLISSVFICYLIFKNINAPVWNALFWIILLFASTNAIARSFVHESRGRMMYYHTIAQPLSLLLAKMLLNIILCLFVALLGLGVFSLLLGSPSWPVGPYLYFILSFSIGIGALFSAISAIIAKTKGSNLLMPVLSFPLVIPLLLIAVSASNRLIANPESAYMKDVLLLLLVDALIVMLGFVLYRFIWQE